MNAISFRRLSLLAYRAGRAMKARHRLLRRKLRAARKWAVLRIRLALLWRCYSMTDSNLPRRAGIASVNVVWNRV